MNPQPKTRLRLLALSMLMTGAAAAQDPVPSLAGSETIDVELKTVPFYAVDAEGRPVYDLTLDELVIRVDGELATPDTLDRWSRSADTPQGEAAVAETPGAAAAPPPAAAPPRQVFLLFDEAFLSKVGWKRSQRLAVEVIDQLPASDHLHLLMHDSVNGLRYVLGPAADATARQVLRETVEALKPGTAFLRAHLEQTGLPPLRGGGRSRGGEIGSQEKNTYEAAGRLARAEYQTVAVDLAEGFEALATHFERIAAPKLLMVFSSGIESSYYFEGSFGFGPGSSNNAAGAYHGRALRLEPIHAIFERSLAKLAGAGVVPIFVNPETTRAVGSDTLLHMSEVTGGLFLDGGKLASLETRIAAATSAYYEAGFYLRQQPALERAAKIEIEIRRPGVWAVFPNRLKNRQRFSSLSDPQKQFVIVDLIHRGTPTPHLAALHALEGELLQRPGAAPGGKSRVAFQAAWPAAIAGKQVDVYDVALKLAEGGEPEVVRFDRRQLAAAGQPLRVETALPRADALVWGIVAVEPASGAAYVRRLKLDPGS